jgi:putative ABC transport system ATP-binding protein
VIKPALVMADEPTGNLDSNSSAQIVAMLRELVDVKGQTVLMVTHDSKVATQADRIIQVKDGKIESDRYLKEPPIKKDILKLIRRGVG